MTRSNTVVQNPFTAFTGLNSGSVDAMQKGYQRAIEMAGEMTALNKASMTAFTESAQLAAKGMTAINSRTMDYARQAVRTSSDASRQLATAKSFQEVVDVESQYLRDIYSKNLEEVTALTSMYLDTARKSTKPLMTQAGKTVETLRTSS